MKEAEAMKIAREFLCKRIQIEYCTNPPPMIMYNYDQSKHFLFTFKLGDYPLFVGGDDYIAVSKENGEVSYFGNYGE